MRIKNKNKNKNIVFVCWWPCDISIPLTDRNVMRWKTEGKNVELCGHESDIEYY